VGNYSTLDYYDPEFKDDIKETSPNIGFGVMFFSDKYYLGVSVPELTIRSLGTASVQQANYLKSHYYFTGGYLADLAEDIKFKPTTLSIVRKWVAVTGRCNRYYLFKRATGRWRRLPYR
jgi:hypothetical protein